MSEENFYQKVQPLIERVALALKAKLVKISGNHFFISDMVNSERWRLMFAASELAAKPDGARVRVDKWTEANREEFVQYLNERLAGESEDTVWVYGKNDDD